MPTRREWFGGAGFLRADVLDRHPTAAVLVLLAICVAVTLPHALAKPFWHDEIYTILVSRLPSFQAMWRAALDGVDLAPPLSVWLTRGAHALFGVGLIATRLPALCGFYVAVVVVFFLLRRRIGSAGAIAGALLLLFTAAPRYAAEARAYGPMIGLFACALYFWMEAADGRRRRLYLPLLAVTLAASIWNHYYGVLAFAPVAAGELARLARNRRFDLPMAAAVGAALLAVVPLWPLVRVAAAHRATFWAAIAPAEPVVELYRFLLQPLLDSPFVMAGILLALVVAWWPASAPLAEAPPRRPSHEWAALGTALAIPLLGFVLGRIIGGAMVPRYILSGAIAIGMAVPLAIAFTGRRRALAALVLMATLVIAAATSVVDAWYPARIQYSDPVTARPLLVQSLRLPGPTVVSSSLQFLQLWYYTPPALKPKLAYLASAEQAGRWSGSDTIDRGYLALSRAAAVPVFDYEAFIASHREFRVYEAGSGWLLDALRNAGASVQLTAREPAGRLYLVRLP